MQGYIVRRVLALVPTLIFASFIVFISIHMMPGNIIDLMLSQNDLSAARQSREQLEAALGLDTPIYIQYFKWIGALLFKGSLGSSLWTNTPVMDEILYRLPITLELGLLSLIVSLIFGIPIGVYAALRQDTIGEYILRAFSILSLAIPGFWVGTLVMVFPSIWWGWSPSVKFIQFFEDPWGNFLQLLLPALILGNAFSAITMRLTRTLMLEVMRQDYIRTAKSKGLSTGTIVMRHALRNALIPVITLAGLQAGALIGGAVILEQIFVVPGMGLLLLEAVNSRDHPTVTGVFLIFGLAIVFINLLVDVSYGVLDPKMRGR